MTRPARATIAYETFAELWKRLVSKKKARKLDVDREVLWSQLAAGVRVELHKDDDDEDRGGSDAAGRDGNAPHRPAARQAAVHVRGKVGARVSDEATPVQAAPERRPDEAVTTASGDLARKSPKASSPTPGKTASRRSRKAASGKAGKSATRHRPSAARRRPAGTEDA